MGNWRFQEVAGDSSMDIEKIIEEYHLDEEIIRIRRAFHRIPELGEQEFETGKLIRSKLEEWGVPYRDEVADTGIVAVVTGGHPGRTVALRADIDALPIREETGLPFVSQNPGVMHACGHDAHIAMALMTCFILSRLKERLNGNVKFLFQPAEETVGGAERMIRDGCMHEPEVDYVLGLHVEPKYDTGTVGIRYGKMYAGSDMFNVDITGKGAHGAHPEDGVDAIAIAANVINAVQTVVSRSVGATNSAVVTFGLIRGGTVRNQIADTVHMEGIMRTLDPKTRLDVRNRVGRIIISTAEALGGRADYTVMESYGPLINDDVVTRIVEGNAVALLGREHIVSEKEPDLCCEDFSYFALEKPACYFHLGCYDESNGPRVDLHHGQFTIDERCLMIGARLQCANILSILKGAHND